MVARRAITKEEALAVLRELEPELKQAGVTHLSLFGSVARGDNKSDSDIDIAVQVNEGFASSGLDHFFQLDQLEKTLSRKLGRYVDVVSEPARKERFQKEIDRDRVLAF